MLLSSYDFLIFMAILCLFYYGLPETCQRPLLLAGSYVFYFMAGPMYMLNLVFVTVTVYFLALKIDRLEEMSQDYICIHRSHLSQTEIKTCRLRKKYRQRRYLLAGLAVNLGMLAFLKYEGVVLPMGISFYTFQAVGYLIDVYRGTVKAEKHFWKFALFVSFFPQLVQGPISRFRDLSPELYARHPFDGRAVSYGLQRILWGFFKKLVIADRIMTGVNTLFCDTHTYGGAYVFVGMMFYALQLYADFTGGIDIALGAAEMLGIRVAENFNRPFFSKSVKEYWRRWHMTMGTWFTDYVFYPVSVCRPMLKLSKFSRKYLGEKAGKRVPVYLSSFIVWLATGMWHGVGWNFIVWGLGNWIVIMISQELEPFYTAFHKRFRVGQSNIFRSFQVVRTIVLMSCLRTFDCYRNVPLTFRMLRSLLTGRNWNILWDGSLMHIGLSITDYIILTAGLIVLFGVSMLQRKGKVRDRIAAQKYAVRIAVWFGLFLIVLLMGVYGALYDESQFIYNQF